MSVASYCQYPGKSTRPYCYVSWLKDLKIIKGEGRGSLAVPFSGEFLNNGTLLAHSVRALRYGIVIFAITAIYPMLFKFVPFRGKNEEEQKNDNL